jgi:phenylpropionate dioxygenase-like ring-hydroxylating dioxygenase large terminal subunit
VTYFAQTIDAQASLGELRAMLTPMYGDLSMSQPLQYRPLRRSTLDVSGLVQDGRVHSAVFTDRDIYEQELDRIFHGSWLYIGHTSEVPKKGDFRTRQMGKQPVVMIRGTDGQVRVLLNRCRHRGAVVCEKEAGNTKHLRCWYHGWVYDSTGRLTQVPAVEAYGEDFTLEKMSLASPPMVEEYRGFIFASLSANVVPLREHLGKAAEMMDLLIDASPVGEIRVSAGVHKTVYRGNWKLVGMDGYHVHYVHASVIAAWNRNSDTGIGATHRGDPFDDHSASRTRDLGHGHAMLDLTTHRMSHYEKFTEMLAGVTGGTEYVQAMHAKHGEKARLLISLAGDPHVGFFPNLQLINNQIRIMNPLGPDETEVLMFPVLFEGVSSELNEMRLRQHESFYGPAGSGSPDDGEIFERVQKGLHAQVEPWVEISRGMNREKTLDDGTVEGLITDEVPQRGQFREWLSLMTGDAK